MLVIRLRRTGRVKKPSYRVIVAEKSMPIYGRFVDIIGNVNLLSNPKVIEINKEKAIEWMNKGAQPSDTVARLMVKVGILKKEDLNWGPDKKSKKKKDEGKEEEKKPVVTPSNKEETAAEEAPKDDVAEEKKEETALEAKEEDQPTADQPKTGKTEEKPTDEPKTDEKA